MNFFEVIQPHINKLSKSEYALLDYVVKNLVAVQHKSIREIAAECFVSTTTFLRFVRKIGFSGYSEFSTVIKYTILNTKETNQNNVTFTQKQSKYRNEYLKNLEETVRVLDERKLAEICQKLASTPKLFFYAKGLSKNTTAYIEYLYTLNDFIVITPHNHEQRQWAYRNIKKEDLIFIFNYSGEDEELIQIIQTIKTQTEHSSIISVTGANNNTIQNLSDINLYLFTDEITVQGVDMTSNVSMIIIMELLLYQYWEHQDSINPDLILNKIKNPSTNLDE
ncbi:MurR/RpiR family transcriptional regulator [Xylocopilactobacillus apicola]|uniref:Phosphosugar-binding protein n=1 Tax=Xylocopilactobacillus apicola TaxID=2932184 RepID=A0AAU9DVY0_9LACO|nr:MurR/RpiR family transcriptional regulator [Xylocopilactobacillus apicola]BDR58083.1 phosphosugar-binding protein [Xylocopilactobacillus apicola]